MNTLHNNVSEIEVTPEIAVYVGCALSPRTMSLGEILQGLNFKLPDRVMRRLEQRKLTIPVPASFRQSIEQLKKDLASHDYWVLEFLGTQAGTPEDVWDTDIGHVSECDVFICDLTHPSIGVGMELMLAVYLKKPVLILISEGARLTRLVIGGVKRLEKSQKIELYEYSSYAERSEHCLDFLLYLANSGI